MFSIKSRTDFINDLSNLLQIQKGVINCDVVNGEKSHRHQKSVYNPLHLKQTQTVLSLVFNARDLQMDD